ncbi:MAG: hypothetical protein MJZ38_05575 [archaeon]|nr:hypothetical protein [archaeon]
MDRESFQRWKQTTYMSQIKNISLIDEGGNDLKAPGIVYPADCPFKDAQ